ncbi:uncharacterized protein LOC135694586 [Rhopilema esculentum]|uniref:uncharacterized protein LOC135694586 n=1 Tax=Rhopilema esculentum TaxID=499914 RepID=UPI0031D423CF
MLQLHAAKTFCVEKNPVRPNIMYIFEYVNKNKGLDEIFQPIIDEVLHCKTHMKRTIIFCQTKKQCSILFRAFSISLGENFFASSELLPSNRLVDIFHAGTPENVKSHVINQMAKSESCLRVLICTVAFGMGINCRGLYRSIHLGPPKSMEALLQETGRLGRDESSATSYVLYNGILNTLCNIKMKILLQHEMCRRREIGKHFNAFSSLEMPKQCMCCDNCAMDCNCSDQCLKGDSKFTLFSKQMETELPLPKRKRNVTKEQKEELTEKLYNLKTEIEAELATVKPVGTTSVKFEFCNFQVHQIIAECMHIFSIEDIFLYVEIWRRNHAVQVLHLLYETFQDFEINLQDISCSDEESSGEQMEIIHEDWGILQHANTFNTTTSSLLALDESDNVGLASDNDGSCSISGFLSSAIEKIHEEEDIEMEN